MMTPVRPSLWRIIRPTSICLRSLWHTARGWPWQPGVPCLSSTARSIPWPWRVRLTTRALACCACSMTTSMLASRGCRTRPASAAQEREARSVTGGGPAAGRQEGRGAQGATGQGGSVRVQRAWHTPRTASASLGGGGKGAAGRPAYPRETDRASLHPRATKGAGGPRLPQADDHDVSDPSAGKCAEGLYGRAGCATADQGESRLYLTTPL